MKIIDISMEIREDMMVYKDKPEKMPKVVNVANHEDSEHYETDVTMNLHTGTHIDAPLHMIDGGERMDSYSIEQFIAEAKVLDLTDVNGGISKEDLEKFEINKGDFLLFKTKNSFDTKFNFDFIYLDTSGAHYLRDKGIKGVGTDALGIERAQPDRSTHISLLERGIMIVEGLQLAHVEEGKYQLIVLPIKLLNTEAAPARAILIQQ